ncbi:hypothetical protein KR044_012650, partial [Drosophila immigrans]
MINTRESNMDVASLCEAWKLKQLVFESDISSLLKKSKRVAAHLNSSNNDSNTLTQDQRKLHELMVHLTEELQRRRDEASAKERLIEWQKSLDRMRAKIRKISQTLGEVGLLDKSEIDKLCDAVEYTQPHYEALSQELQRCEKLRQDNLEILVDHVWTEMLRWYKMTLQHPIITKCQQDCPSVELLELLEQKLIDLQQFYQEQNDIFQLYAKRIELWTRMLELDELASDPSRYRNRGGQLLHEEKERNRIQNKLPVIEAKLGELVRQYEEQSGQQFMVFSVEIMHQITIDWDEYRLNKVIEMQRRKQTMFQSNAPRLIKGSSTASSLISLRKETSL